MFGLMWHEVEFTFYPLYIVFGMVAANIPHFEASPTLVF